MLESLLRAIDTEHADASWNIMANVAENAPGAFVNTNRLLRPGDRVVIGYDTEGNPVTSVAGAGGLAVTSAQAAGLQSGLSAGLYPVGSQLYSVPPAARLSLYEAAADGQSLASARELLTTRIDGRVTNLIYSTVPEDLAEVAAITRGARFAAMGEIGTAALGAVNAGDILTGLTAERVVGPIGVEIDLLKARIVEGQDASYHAAVTDTVFAMRASHRELGGAPDLPAVRLNIAANLMPVTAAVVNRTMGVAIKVNSITATAIGAVNGGLVGR